MTYLDEVMEVMKLETAGKVPALFSRSEENPADYSDLNFLRFHLPAAYPETVNENYNNCDNNNVFYY